MSFRLFGARGAARQGRRLGGITSGRSEERRPGREGTSRSARASAFAEATADPPKPWRRREERGLERGEEPSDN